MEDNLLIEEFLSGKIEAFEMLVKRYQNQVVNIVHSLGVGIQIAEDVAQDVFIKAYNNLSYFNKRSKFSTWLYRITVNTAYNYLNKEKKYTSFESVAEPATSGRKTALDLERREEEELVGKAIEELPFKYRTVVVLKDIEGLSYNDIAKTLHCRIGTVESRLFRARAILRKRLAYLLK